MRKRTMRLADQLAEAGFPSGVGVPSAVVLALTLLLATSCVLYLESPATKSIPGAVVASQERFAEATARSMAKSVTEAVMDLRFAVTQSGTNPVRHPDELLGSLGEVYPRWRGMAVLQSSTRRLLAARGEPVPLEALDPGPLREASICPVARMGKGVLMVAAVPFRAGDEERILVAATDLYGSEFPLDSRLAQSVLVVTADAHVLDSRGPVPAADDRASQTLIGQAAAESATGRTGSKVDLVAGEGSVRRVSPGDSTVAVAVVAYAPLAVAGLSGTLGLSLVSVAHVPEEEGEPAGHHPAAAVALVVVALLGFALVRLTVVGPVHRLRADAIAVASGGAARKVRVSGVREVRRIAAVVEQCRSPADTEVRKRRLTLSARQAIGLSAVAMVLWSGAVTFTIGMSTPEVPDVVVRERGMEVSRIADSVRRSLNGGVADLKLLARFSGHNDASVLPPLMERLISREARYRSIYVVDSAGRVTVQVGRPPLRAEESRPPGEGVRQYNTAGRLPVIFAYAPMPDTQHTVVGEFDVEHMSELLRQSAGRVRVVDPGFRTIADTEGYLAFDTLSEESLRRSVGEALAGKPRAEIGQAHGGPSVIASAVVGGAGPVAVLRWGVVAEQPTGALGLPENELRRRCIAAGLLGTVIALLLFGWHEFMVVRPLRRTAVLADRFAAGATGSGIYPVRQDQIGTITSCLEICRKAASESADRKDPARRES